MAKQFVVIDENNEVSWSAKTDAAEAFDKFDAAERRAKELAKSEPGRTIGVYGLLAEVMAPVGKVLTRRKA